jgi:hypothetical protein
MRRRVKGSRPVQLGATQAVCLVQLLLAAARSSALRLPPQPGPLVLREASAGLPHHPCECANASAQFARRRGRHGGARGCGEAKRRTSDPVRSGRREHETRHDELRAGVPVR